MKTNVINRWLTFSGAVTMFTAVLLLCSCPPGVTAAESDVQDLREKAARLQREAQELKAEGKADRAQELMRQVEELRAQADQLRQGAKPAKREQPRPELIKRQLEQAQAELDELRAAGKEKEVQRQERRVQELRTALERFNRQQANRNGKMREPLPGREPRDFSPEGIEMQQMRHLQVAIENLHAAGMHEPAERLAQHAREMRQNPSPGERPSFGGSPQDRPEGELNRLRMEMQELRQAVRELAARLDQISRERR